MKKKKEITCPNCGSIDIEIDEHRNIGKCRYCNQQFVLPDEVNNKEYDVGNGIDKWVKRIKKSFSSVNHYWLVTLLLCIFLGVYGVHRFYTRKYLSGALYLCTQGLLYVGWIIDIIIILSGEFTDGDGNKITK